MRVNDLYEAGVIYVPYIPLYTEENFPTNPEIAKRQRRLIRKQELMRCPSFPYSCTGDCGSPEHMKRIDRILKQEFGDV
jgi:hypothetical protein